MTTELPLEIHHIYIAILKRNFTPLYLTLEGNSILTLSTSSGQTVFISLPDLIAIVP